MSYLQSDGLRLFYSICKAWGALRLEIATSWGSRHIQSLLFQLKRRIEIRRVPSPTRIGDWLDYEYGSKKQLSC